MSTPDPDRPAPEAFLKDARAEGRGKLKVFLGAAPGVGKTYEMLTEAAQRLAAGIDVVIGIVESHGRAETEALVRPFEIIPRHITEHNIRALDEMDLDALLARRPKLALVDELAHTNAAGSRHPKRYQDIEELLAAGIDVYSTINVQHIESLNDVVASFTRVRVRETVPDRVLEDAELEVVDIPPDELIERLKAGKVYVPAEATRALGHFFSKTNLQALRELALRRAAQAVDAQMLDHLKAHALGGSFAAGERVLVAVSELPNAPELVRSAKRLADALKAPWTALHVETQRSRALGPVEQARLAATLALASQLGGATATIPAINVVAGLRSYAVDTRATQIVIGKSARSWWFELRHGSVVDRLVRGMGDVAVHVLPSGTAEDIAAKQPRSVATGRAMVPGDYVRATLMVAAMTLAGLVVARFVGVNSVDMMYLVPVFAAASLYGLRAGLFAGLLSALAYNFFFLPPLYTFTINDGENAVTVLVLLGVAVAASQLAGSVRIQADLATRSAQDNAALAGFSRQLTGVATLQELGQGMCAEFARLFDVRAILLKVTDGELEIVAASPPEDKLGAIEMAAAQWVADKGRPAGRGADTLPAADWLFQPLSAGGKTRGVLGFSRDDGRDPLRADQMPLLASLLDQASLAAERIRLEGEMAGVAQLEQRDRLRAALLSSVGHDLRTPLTTILASASELRRRFGSQDDTAFEALEAETHRLSRFVSNLLDMARIEAGALRLEVEAIDLTDAVASAVHDARAALSGHAIKLEVPCDLPLVRVDPKLFHHCLLNLLDNAGKYGEPGTPVTIATSRTPDELVLKVLDVGEGLPDEATTRIFETFTRIEGSDRGKTGTGLGLAIVKGFAEAMGLRVSAGNRDDGGGSCFALHIPAQLLVKVGTAVAA